MGAKIVIAGKIWMELVCRFGGLDGGGGADEDLRDSHLMDYALNQLIAVWFVTIC